MKKNNTEEYRRWNGKKLRINKSNSYYHFNDHKVVMNETKGMRSSIFANEYA